MAVVDGGLLQLLQLIFWGYLGVACYLVFKGCLDGLLARVPPRLQDRTGPPASP